MRKRKRGSDVFLIEDFSKSALLTVTANALVHIIVMHSLQTTGGEQEKVIFLENL